MEHDGIVAVGDICNGTSTFELKRNSRIHYHNFIEGFGLRTTDFSFLRRIAAESEALGLSASVTPARHLFAAGRRVPGDRRSGKPAVGTLYGKPRRTGTFRRTGAPSRTEPPGRRNDRFRRIRIAGRTHRRLGPERKKICCWCTTRSSPNKSQTLFNIVSGTGSHGYCALGRTILSKGRRLPPSYSAGYRGGSPSAPTASRRTIRCR